METGENMKVLTVASTKGGTGKSTVAANLSVASVMDGQRTLLIDADPQCSSIMFFQKRQAEDLKAMRYNEQDYPDTSLTDVIEQVKTQFDRIIIDVGGFDGRLLRLAVLAADLVIAPVTPSQFDIWAAKNVVEVIDLANKAASRSGRPVQARLLLNQVIQNTHISRASVEALKSIASTIPMLKTVLQQRVAFKESIAQGLGVLEYAPSSKAAEEIHRLYAEVSMPQNS